MEHEDRETPYSVDVVLVTFNNSGQILEAIDSVCLEAGIDISFYIQDNGSTDNTVREIRQYRMPPDVDLHLEVDDTNPGFAKAVNAQISKGQSQFVLVLNPDTCRLETTPKRLISELCELASGATVGLVSPRLVTESGLIDPACMRREPTVPRALATFAGKILRSETILKLGYNYLGASHGPVEVDAINGAFMLAQRSKIEAVGLLDERYWMYAEDLDWCRSFRARGYRNLVSYDSEWVHLKRGSEGGRRGIRTQIAFYRAMSKYFSKHHSGLAYAPMRLLVTGLTEMAVLFATSTGPFRNTLGRTIPKHVADSAAGREEESEG